MTLGTQIVDYLGDLELAGGDRDGERLVVLPWERRFVMGTFARSGNSALSVARGNGKSALVAGIATAVIDPTGPLHGRRREVVVVAASFEQARICFEDCVSFLRGRGFDLEDRRTWRKQDSANRAWIEHRVSGARVRCIGSDPATAHGLRPMLALVDEPAQHEPARRDRMLSALQTGLGKVPGSKLIALGTRPVGDDHWFSRMLKSPGVDGYSQVHAAGPDDPPFRLRTWRKANPSIDHLPSLKAKIASEAVEARLDPSMLASFRALRLNQGVSDVDRAMLLSADVWQRIEGEAEALGRPFWGIDLGTSAAQSAVAAYWPRTGPLECMAAFPDEPDLSTRGRNDGVGDLYVKCQRRGELIQTHGAAVDVVQLIIEARDRFGAPAGIASDRWRESELRDALKAAGIPRTRLELRGMGYRDGGEDVRGFRRLALEDKVTPTPSLMLTYAMSEAVCVMDPAGNAKLAKSTEGGRRLRARDDAAAASILAVGLASRQPKRRSTGVYLGVA